MKLEKKIYTERAEERRDFWIGVGVVIGLNLILLIIGGLISWELAATSRTFGTFSDKLNAAVANSPPLIALFYQCLAGLPFVINFLVMLYFALTRSQVALGMLTTFGVLFALAFIIGGCFLIYACFAQPAGSI